MVSKRDPRAIVEIAVILRIDRLDQLIRASLGGLGSARGVDTRGVGFGVLGSADTPLA